MTIGSVLAVLALSANTAFADFPRLCRVIGENGYLPSVRPPGPTAGVFGGNSGAGRGGGGHSRRLRRHHRSLDSALRRRSVPGIHASQAGMVAHWWRLRGGITGGSRCWFNAAGAVYTGVTLVVVLVSKFLRRLGDVLADYKGLLFVFLRGQDALPQDRPRAGNRRAARPRTTSLRPSSCCRMRGWSVITRKALHFAMKISHEIYALHIAGDEQTMVALEDGWNRLVREPAQKVNLPAAKLIIIYSPFRRLYRPLIEVVTDLRKTLPGPRHRRDCAIPELVGANDH